MRPRMKRSPSSPGRRGGHLRHWRCVDWCVWMLLSGVAGCIPYTVGATAQPVPQGDIAPSLLWYSIPNGIELLRDTTAVAFSGFDLEGRLGVSDRADMGVRIPALAGLVVTYKYRLTSSADRTAAAVAVMGDGGLVNWGNHAYFELTLLASGHQSLLTPYGGLGASQVAPLSSSAPSDSPTAGGFLGLRVGREQLGVSPEVGVYYDRSALGVRSREVIVVLALVLHGSELLRVLTEMIGGGRR